MARTYASVLPSRLLAYITGLVQQQPAGHVKALNELASAGSKPVPAQAGSMILEGLVKHLVEGLPLHSLRSFLVVREQANGPADRCIPQRARETFLAELRGMPLYQVG